MFVAAVLYLRRRWVLPFGSLTVMCSLLAVLFPFFTAWRYPEMVGALVVTGVLRRRAGAVADRRRPARVLRIRLFAALLPIAIWAPFLLAIALFSGLGWNETVWTGILSTTAGVGYGISLIMFPPALPSAPAAGRGLSDGLPADGPDAADARGPARAARTARRPTPGSSTRTSPSRRATASTFAAGSSRAMATAPARW